MKKLMIAVFALWLATPAAFAHGWHHDHRGYYRHDHDGNIAAAVVGGAVLGYLLGQQQIQRQSYAPPPQYEYYQQPQPIEHCERTWVWDPYLHRQIEQTRCYRVR